MLQLCGRPSVCLSTRARGWTDSNLTTDTMRILSTLHECVYVCVRVLCTALSNCYELNLSAASSSYLSSVLGWALQ